MRVVVTGCAGYVGGTLLSRLLRKDEYRVVGIDNFDCSRPDDLSHCLGEPNFTFHWRDIATVNGDLIQGADAVVHLAALVGEPLCRKRREAAWAINHGATRRLVSLLRPSQRLIYLNTNSGYGTTSGERECDETSPLNPLSDYAKSKCEGESEVLKHANSVSLRLATVFGYSPKMRFDLMVNHFVREIHQRGKIVLFEPHFLRNFVHVRDVARAIDHMLRLTHLTGVYNVGLPSANLTKMQLALKVCDVLGVPRTNILVGDGMDPDRRNYRVSNGRILSTGFHFAHTLEDGITSVAQVCDFFPPSRLAEMSNV